MDTRETTRTTKPQRGNIMNSDKFMSIIGSTVMLAWCLALLAIFYVALT